MLATIALAVGCGGASDDAAPGPSSSSASDASSSADEPAGHDQPSGAITASTRGVTDFFGNEIEVPSEPQRVFAADTTALANLLDLGVRPIGTSVNIHSVPDFLGSQLEGVTDVSTAGNEINLEATAALDPDLVLTFGVDWAVEDYDALQQVAPTFGYEYGYATSEQIRTNMTELGRVLGLEEEAAAKVQRLDDRVADLRSRIEAAGLAGEPISVLRVFEDGNLSLRHGSPESVMLEEIGLGRPENQRSIEDFATDVSAENLDAIDAHAVFVYVDDTNPDGFDAILGNPLWQTLDATANDRVFQVDGGVWNGISLAACHAILDDIEQALLGT